MLHAVKEREHRLPDLHVIPPNEEEHIVSPECYCCPLLQHQDQAGRRVWVHHSREEAN